MCSFKFKKAQLVGVLGTGNVHVNFKSVDLQWNNCPE